jgi:ribonuclease VapC
MLIDTSVLVAVHNKEPGYEDLLLMVANAKRRWLSVPSYVEFAMVTKDADWIDGLVNLAEIKLIELSKDDAAEAVKGFLRYGKGVNPAGLNFGDCLMYGTAKATRLNLLFKGDDFSRTDLISVLVHGEEVPA